MSRAQSSQHLPPGWRLVRFGDVVRNVNANVRDTLESGLECFVGLDHLDPESLHIKRWGLIQDGTTFTRRFVTGQVLFGKRRAYQRKAAVAEFDGICSGDILVFEPADDQLLPELLPFIVQSDGFFEHALGTSAGSLSPRTKWQDLARYEFALPPQDEQRHIAEILWTADEAVQGFVKLAETAVTTKEAIANHLLDFQSDSTSDGVELVSVDELEGINGPIFKTGPFGSSLKTEYFSDSGVPVLNISALGEVGLAREGLFYLSEEYAEKFDSYRVTENDIVFSRVAEVGRCILIPKECEGWIISSNLIRIRLDDTKVYPLYFFICSNTVHLSRSKSAV